MALRERMLETIPLPHMVLYLDTDPQVCFDRIHNLRKRECESGIPLDYLSGLDSCYKMMMQHIEGCGCQAVSVDWNGFGNANSVIEEVSRTLCNVARGEVLQDFAAAQKFIYNKELVEDVMQPHVEYEATDEFEDAITSNSPSSLFPTKPQRPSFVVSTVGSILSKRILVAQPISPTRG